MKKCFYVSCCWAYDRKHGRMPSHDHHVSACLAALTLISDFIVFGQRPFEDSESKGQLYHYLQSLRCSLCGCAYMYACVEARRGHTLCASFPWDRVSHRTWGPWHRHCPHSAEMTDWWVTPRFFCGCWESELKSHVLHSYLSYPWTIPCSLGVVSEDRLLQATSLKSYSPWNNFGSYFFFQANILKRGLNSLLKLTLFQPSSTRHLWYWSWLNTCWIE